MVSNPADDGIKNPLKVTLSMLTFVPGGMGGTETCARELAWRLSALPQIDAEIVVPESARGVIRGVREVVVDGLRVGHSTPARIAGLARAILKTRQIKKLTAAADVIHYPFTVQGVKASRTQATVLTVFDVQHRDLPQFFSRLERLFRVFTYERPARKADSIITISEFAKETIVRHLRVPEERITVAHLGVDTASFTPNRGTREKFVFYPARGWPHKNHPALIKAMEILRRTHPDLRLVLTGGNLDGLGELPNWVENRGLVPLSELHDLYRRAAVLAFPSLYEGFGLPPLEAMASGCPVAAADSGSLPEICGDAAVMFDPTNPEAIARGIAEAISRTAELSAAGIERVKMFTWDRCAELHTEAYRSAMARAALRR